MLRNEKKSSRKLRSGDTKPLEDKNLFNFDNINHYLYRSKPIPFNDDPNSNQLPLYRYFRDEVESTPQPPPLKHGEIKRIKRTNIKYDPKIEDPLPDSTYHIFHRKMRKEEAQMLNEEKIKNLMELDNFQNYLQLLNQYDWIRHLPQITKINDLKNLEECEEKRQLTIDEIEKMLKKQSIWKKKKDEFANNVRLYHNKGIEFEIVNNGHNTIQVDDETKEEEVPIETDEPEVDEPELDEPELDETELEEIIEESQRLPRKRGPKPKNPILKSPIKPRIKIVKEKLDELNKSSTIDIYGASNNLFGIDVLDLKVSEKGFQLPVGWRKQFNTKK
ncbi:uncharacterized protein KGF55_001345 [Candida pseudojiufengensis]|uniref:uncharacterized protein n=1 Tax=Candida pseudojiufengensis TaxID=497109 RepID=UPI0022243D84|nr:uncharacterized protein KGF55_001345 [Candida pseudojiufengensis]KAI5965981.1 hypothetical protein KGF55_001345 [Candida pseudojiufengensis]